MTLDEIFSPYPLLSPTNRAQLERTSLEDLYKYRTGALILNLEGFLENVIEPLIEYHLNVLPKLRLEKINHILE